MSSGKNFGFSGFKLNKSQPSSGSKPPSSYQTSAKPSYAPSFSRQHKTEEEYLIILKFKILNFLIKVYLLSYFEEDEEPKNKQNSKSCEYQPASDSSTEEEEDDPLDSFMANIEVITSGRLF